MEEAPSPPQPAHPPHTSPRPSHPTCALVVSLQEAHSEQARHLGVLVALRAVQPWAQSGLREGEGVSAWLRVPLALTVASEATKRRQGSNRPQQAPQAPAGWLGWVLVFGERQPFPCHPPTVDVQAQVLQVHLLPCRPLLEVSSPSPLNTVPKHTLHSPFASPLPVTHQRLMSRPRCCRSMCSASS